MESINQPIVSLFYFLFERHSRIPISYYNESIRIPPTSTAICICDLVDIVTSCSLITFCSLLVQVTMVLVSRELLYVGGATMDIKRCTQRNLSVLVIMGVVVALVYVVKKEKGNDWYHQTQGMPCHLLSPICT